MLKKVTAASKAYHLESLAAIAVAVVVLVGQAVAIAPIV